MILSSTNFFMALIISLMIFFIAKTLSLHTNLDREKSSPFECGFDPKNSARLPFSTRFFLLAVIFLVFDIEIALLMPAPLSIPPSSSPSLFITLSMFFFILLAGLTHEWNEGSLDWTN